MTIFICLLYVFNLRQRISDMNSFNKDVTLNEYLAQSFWQICRVHCNSFLILTDEMSMCTFTNLAKSEFIEFQKQIIIYLVTLNNL